MDFICINNNIDDTCSFFLTYILTLSFAINSISSFQYINSPTPLYKIRLASLAILSFLCYSMQIRVIELDTLLFPVYHQLGIICNILTDTLNWKFTCYVLHKLVIGTNKEYCADFSTSSCSVCPVGLNAECWSLDSELCSVMASTEWLWFDLPQIFLRCSNFLFHTFMKPIKSLLKGTFWKICNFC